MQSALYKEPDALVTGHTCLVTFTSFVQSACPVSHGVHLPHMKEHHCSQFKHTDHSKKIAADLTELPITAQGNRYVLVIMDYFTRYVNLFPLKDQRATTVAKCVFEDYIRQHGIPESIHTDQGRKFESDLIKHLCSSLGIEKTRTPPTMPNQTVWWRGQVHQLHMPGISPCVCHMLSKDAAQMSAASKLHQKHQYDKKVVFNPHEASDLVLLDDPVQRMHKLAPRWKGPLVVLKRMSRDGSPGVTYEITDPRNEHSKKWIVHHNRLKAYRGPMPTSPVSSPVPAVPTGVGTALTPAPFDCFVRGPALSPSYPSPCTCKGLLGGLQLL